MGEVLRKKVQAKEMRFEMKFSTKVPFSAKCTTDEEKLILAWKALI